jgi:hypothetical protein
MVERTWTSARLSLLMYVFSFRSVFSSDATFTVTPTTKFRIPPNIQVNID